MTHSSTQKQMGLKSAGGRSLPYFPFEGFVTFDFLQKLFLEKQYIRMLLLAFEEYFFIWKSFLTSQGCWALRLS